MAKKELSAFHFNGPNFFFSFSICLFIMTMKKLEEVRMMGKHRELKERKCGFRSKENGNYRKHQGIEI